MAAKTTAQAKATKPKALDASTKAWLAIFFMGFLLNLKPVPKPKTPPKTTDKQFREWYYSQGMDQFTLLAREWNEKNLKISIPQLEGYDDWLNYFKRLSPNVIRKLATTGLDFLPTDGYAALARWHDIISNPHRIDKIHQAGLDRKPGSKSGKTITELAHNNDRLGVLMAIRDEIAGKIQKGAGARDTSSLAKEMSEIMSQIAAIEKRQGPKKTTKLGQLMADVDLRSRPSRNGGGSRNGSFKSRVTIKQMESI